MFWNRRRKDDLQRLLQEQTQSISEQIREAQDRLSAQSDSVMDLVNKLGRLQTKTSHEALDKLQKLLQSATESTRRQAEIQLLSTRTAALEKQLDEMAAQHIQWIDDFDVLTQRLKDTAQANWSEMFLGWTNRLLGQLNEVGIQEIPVIGASFDARWCESVGTVDPVADGVSPHHPYEVVEVVRRGFVAANGNVVRKAQVITVKGADTRDE